MRLPALRPTLAAVVAVVFLAVVGFSLAQSSGAQTMAPLATADTGVPDAVTLTDGWEFRTDDDDLGRDAGWRTGDWDNTADWEAVTVPHVFNPDPVDEEFLGTVGWYRLRLTTPEASEGFAWALRFEAARRDATVFLNGRRIGRNDNPYQEFTLVADGMRPAGEENTLVVRLSNERDEDLREGWWNWGGLTRPVTLRPVGRVTVNDLGILSDAECAGGSTDCDPIARADGIVESHVDVTTSPTIEVALTSPGGDRSTHAVVVEDLEPFERRRIGFRMDVDGEPMLWSPKTPNLYAARTTVSLGDEVTDVDDRHIGLRFVRVVDGQLFLNGRRLQLSGASVQDDLPGRGAALGDDDIEVVVDDLKRLGANVTREQYPMSEQMMTRFDQEGILVWSQAPVYHEDEKLKTAAGRQWGLNRVRHTIVHARNHPSVITHSVANELSPYADDMPGTRQFLIEASRLARDLDDTVPASVDLLSYPNIDRQEAYASFGLLGINSYYGWYDGKDGAQSTANLDDLEPFLRSMRDKYPRQAMVITEFGAESTFDGPRDEKETYAFQAEYVRRSLQITRSVPWMAGAIYWTAREFYVKPDWDGGAKRRGVERDALHNKGLIHYADGRPKPAFYVARDEFRATPLFPDG